ncbi:uncharacterized protein LOC127093823 [Lathyrus oleraceus]|uniref:uncharacterized protein LOC127093823 n=1 Tax=Pisum sativum TaxID=3888 RepID=UPI0021CE186A|nr:uncharacterized protein LOC127093823 [Pisum sativum]
MKLVYKKGVEKVDELRPVLDALTSADVIWHPFEDHSHHLQFYDICLYRGGLKWYDTVVLYLSGRCMRHFGYRQYIPLPHPDSDTLDVDFEWIAYHVSMIELICPTIFATASYDVVDDYLDWYYRVSHPHLVPPHRGEVRHVLIPIYG